MKKIYRPIIVVAFGFLFTIPVKGQNKIIGDSLLSRQIMIDKNFNPILQDASKINTLPAIHEPVVKQANINFETREPILEFDKYRLGDTGAGNIRTEVEYEKKKGYLNLGAGYFMSLYGALGYRLVDTENDQLDIYARYNSIDGKVKFADQNFQKEDETGKYNNILARAKYRHKFNALSWSLQAGYENTGFNYYGNPFNANLTNFIFDKNQNIGVFNAETGITSNENHEFEYDFGLTFNNISSKYVTNINDNGFKGSEIGAKVNIGAAFGSDKRIGVRSTIVNQSFSNIGFHSLTVIKANPHFDIEGESFNVSLGANFNYAIDSDNSLALSPNVNLNWVFANKSIFYAGVTGGINKNTVLDILQENRYVDLSSRIAYSKTPYDATIGVKSGAIQGFEFDIFGGYKRVNDDHMYIASNNINYSWGNVGTAIYNNISTGHFGGLIKTTLIPYTDLSAKVTSYFYSGDNFNLNGQDLKFEALNRPKLTVNVGLDIRPTKALTLTANYLLATGRKAYFGGNIQGVNNINEFNARGEYLVLKWFSINASVSNILNQKYETWTGYTHQGICAMGGFNIKF